MPQRAGLGSERAAGSSVSVLWNPAVPGRTSSGVSSAVPGVPQNRVMLHGHISTLGS